MKLTKKQKLINKKERHKKSKVYLKKQERLELTRKDKAWSIEIRKNPCLICNTTENLNAHHIIPREIKETRHIYQNGVSLCPKHHKYGLFSAHKNGAWFMRVLKQKNPDQYDYIQYLLSDIQLKYNHKI